jgi:hypothetical protein
MSTKLQSSFDALSRVIEQFESDGNVVRQVEATTSTTKSEADAELLTATISMPLLPQLESTDATDEHIDTGSESEYGIDSTPIAAEMTDEHICVSYTLPSIQPPKIDTPVKMQPTGAEILNGDAVIRIEVTIGEDTANAESSSDVADTIASALGVRNGECRGESESESDGDNTQLGERSWRSSGSSQSPSSAEGVFGGSVISSNDGANSADDSAVIADTDACQTDAADVTVEDELSQVRDDSVPPYEDETYLQRLYERCNTFSEMSDRIELDVAGETVRRYMIEAGVHSPTKYNNTDNTDQSKKTDSQGKEVVESEPTSDDIGRIGSEHTDSDTHTDALANVSTGSTDQEVANTNPNEQTHTPRPDVTGKDDRIETLSIADEQLVTDGAGLPSNLEIADVIDAVVGSRTVYEVQRRLGIEYRQTRDLLDQLDILDLVLRRLSGGPDPDRGVSYEAIATRIQQCAQTQSKTSAHTRSGSSSGVSAAGVDADK